MNRAAPMAAAIVGATVLSGCASQDLVVVLPEKDGHVGAVIVNPGKGQTLLDKAYATARPSSGGVPTSTSDAGRVDREFGPTLAALPEAPSLYRLFFEFDSDEMTADSKREFERVFPEIQRRAAAEVVVTGYTDAMGTPEINDPLSRERADKVKALLVARNISPESITTVGRGARDPLLPPGPDGKQPRNRRVEITVR